MNIYVSDDGKSAMKLHGDGYLDPILFESQEAVDKFFFVIQPAFTQQGEDYNKAFKSIGWRKLDKFERAGMYFFLDDLSGPHWSEIAEEFRNKISKEFVDNVIRMNEGNE